MQMYRQFNGQAIRQLALKRFDNLIWNS